MSSKFQWILPCNNTECTEFDRSSLSDLSCCAGSRTFAIVGCWWKSVEAWTAILLGGAFNYNEIWLEHDAPEGVDRVAQLTAFFPAPQPLPHKA